LCEKSRFSEPFDQAQGERIKKKEIPESEPFDAAQGERIRRRHFPESEPFDQAQGERIRRWGKNGCPFCG